MKPITRLLAPVAGAVVVVGLTLSPADAAVVENLHFVDTGTEPLDFCEGLNIEVSWTDHVHELIKTRGSGDGFVLFSANVQGTTSFTNLDTGRAFTTTYRANDRDLEVTDNGDGTLTITFASRASRHWYDADGDLVFTDAGHFSGQVSVDHAGTPTDPSDDVEIEDSFVLLKDVGHFDTEGRDFCADIATFTS